MKRAEWLRYHTCRGMLRRHLSGEQLMTDWLLRVASGAVIGFQA